MGDDSRNEYIYKFVSDAELGRRRRDGGRPHGLRRQVPRQRQLYVAKFNADGTGSGSS